MLVVTDIVDVVQYVQRCTIYNCTVQDATLYNTQYNLILYNHDVFTTYNNKQYSNILKIINCVILYTGIT